MHTQAAYYSATEAMYRPPNRGFILVQPLQAQNNLWTVRPHHRYPGPWEGEEWRLDPVRDSNWGRNYHITPTNGRGEFFAGADDGGNNPKNKVLYIFVTPEGGFDDAFDNDNDEESEDNDDGYCDCDCDRYCDGDGDCVCNYDECECEEECECDNDEDDEDDEEQEDDQYQEDEDEDDQYQEDEDDYEHDENDDDYEDEEDDGHVDCPIGQCDCNYDDDWDENCICNCHRCSNCRHFPGEAHNRVKNPNPSPYTRLYDWCMCDCHPENSLMGGRFSKNSRVRSAKKINRKQSIRKINKKSVRKTNYKNNKKISRKYKSMRKY